MVKISIRKILLILIAFLLLCQSNAQRKQGSWKDYLSFSNAIKIAVAGSKVYCVTEGGMFYMDRTDNSINKLSELNGLNDFGIQTIAFCENNEVLIVAYRNSNIDLVYKSQVINLSDIKRKQITGDKTIYNIFFSGDEAFLSCGFGIVVLNLSKQEVKNTYFIGEGGNPLRVNDVELFGSFIYAATESGVFRAEKDIPNLIDYRNWERVENIPNPSGNFSRIVVHSGNLLANYAPGKYDQDELYRLDGDEWNAYLPRIKYIHDVQVKNNYMVVSGQVEIIIVDQNNTITGILSKYRINNEEITPISPKSAAITSDGTIWIADYEHGMVRFRNNDYESIYPDGPKDNKAFSLYSNNGDLWVTHGGRTDSWSNIWQAPRIQLLRNGEWKDYSKNIFPEMDGFFDIVNLAVDPANPDHIYAGSWGGGVLEFRGDEFINRFTNNNSPLQTALPGQPDEPYVRIGGLDFDSEGNLWITNSEVSHNLLKLSPNGDWKSFTLPEIAETNNIGPLIVTENDDKWILVPRGHDAYVVNKTGTQKKRLLVTSYFNNGQKEFFTRMNDVFCIIEDVNGAVWIGTSKGVAVYNNPRRIWDSDTFYAIQPGLDLKDGLYHPLLGTETVTAIAVDGANRKWIGTRGSGVYLVSENGEQEILHFTHENSPLLSNKITAISVNQLSGEVFFGTSEGLISYQGDAISGKDAFADVYIYPNPVRETWHGAVTVTGLMQDTDIKITDITGNLVYKGTSLGGQVVWDGKNLNGKRVKTGVYLVFCTAKNGEKTHVEKLLFIN